MAVSETLVGAELQGGGFRSSRPRLGRPGPEAGPADRAIASQWKRPGNWRMIASEIMSAMSRMWWMYGAKARASAT
jgi:hypothetical protein